MYLACNKKRSPFVLSSVASYFLLPLHASLSLFFHLFLFSVSLSVSPSLPLSLSPSLPLSLSPSLPLSLSPSFPLSLSPSALQSLVLFSLHPRHRLSSTSFPCSTSVRACVCTCVRTQTFNLQQQRFFRQGVSDAK